MIIFVKADLGKGDPLQYIYNTGYLFKTGGTNWSPINYTSTESLISNAWYPKSANATIAMTSAELANPVVQEVDCVWDQSQSSSRAVLILLLDYGMNWLYHPQLTPLHNQRVAIERAMFRG